MAEARQLQYLMKLLDDDSPVVRKAVVKELRDFGPDLERLLGQMENAPTAQQRQLLRELLSGTGEELRAEDLPRPESADLMLSLSTDASRDWLVSQWDQLHHISQDLPRLERGLALISSFVRESAQTQQLTQALDALALEFESSEHPRHEVGLAEFLFHDYQLQGVEAASYYAPQSSDLLHVLESKRGNPISLCCIYILIGHRTGLNIRGCNLPQHFMARIEASDKVMLVDCYNGGKILKTDQLDPETARALEQEYLETTPTADVILGRVLRNLNVAFSMQGRDDLASLMLELERSQLG
jgi:regulator of sirC expression with transglutaminase-like and TPR domain